MDDYLVYKLDAYGREVWQYPATLLELDEHSVQLEASFDLDRVKLDYVVFEQGDRFVETYYDDRWYNVFAVYEGETSDFKGWYCNVCRPAQITEDAVRCEDLALDVWVDPDGQTRIMDRAEFEALAIPEADREEGRRALEQILELADEEALPT